MTGFLIRFLFGCRNKRPLPLFPAEKGSRFMTMQPAIGRFFLFVSLLLLSAPLVIAQEAPPKQGPTAEAILKAAHKRMYGIKDQTSQVTFRIVDTDGTEKKTIFRLYWKNYAGQENLHSKTLLVTESPVSDKGIKFLLWERAQENQADLWLYLPELRQVRRLQPGRHKHDNEPDSDLLFEDMHQRPVEWDEHQLLPESEVRGEPCYVVESKLKDHHLYGKKILHLSKNEGTLRKVDYFSEDGTLLKTQWIDWQLVDKSYVWKGSQVVNAESSRKTFVEVSDVKINVGLQDDQFSERALRR
ncbi:MAG: outer membrane lipoprotein-sorting protein [Candidatus Manganitrophus sp.]|nr:outer membrane lipoprotein-sorting protein [Candidatus Manganitrophus sp.]WDT69347.1 MAG: outer membrane lipoprotein-sorting protein [Candidatus Manganitrophus sp.]WDT79071.1 MAG: outer membrane lipoprotein-sorting protein [Candidatus Manganitrophus sp.]